MRTLFVIIGLVLSFLAEAKEELLARQARAFLELPENKAGFKVAPKSNALTSFDIVLAVKRDIDKEFKAVLVVGMGEKMCTSKTTGFDTTCLLSRKGKTNGLNTPFVVYSSGEWYKVYGIRRVAHSPKGRREGVYTPYSDSLNVESVRRAGKEYVDRVIARAMNELQQAKVVSLIGDGELVSNRVRSDLIHKLAIIEHIDETRFETEPPEQLVSEVYTIYGLNQEIAYTYAVSTEGARGKFQIIPKTYAGMVKTYPRAGINKNFFEGTTDHVNAAKVAILLADHDVSLLAPNVRTQVFLDKKKYEEYVASSYNGGPSRAKKILAAGKDFVMHNTNRENRIFLAKLRALKFLN